MLGQMDKSSETPGRMLRREGKVKAAQAVLDGIDERATRERAVKKILLTAANSYEKPSKFGHAKECLWGQPDKSYQSPGRVSERAEKVDAAQTLHDVIDERGTRERAIKKGLLTIASLYESGHAKECLWGQLDKSCQSPRRVSEKAGKLHGARALHGAFEEHAVKELPSVTSLCEKLSKTEDVNECLSGHLDNSYESPENVPEREGKVDGAQALQNRPFKIRVIKKRVVENRVIKNCVIRKRVIKKYVINEDLPPVSSLCEKLSKSEDVKECLSVKMDDNYEPSECVSDREGKADGAQALHGATKEHVPREDLPSVNNLHEKHSKSGHAEESLSGKMGHSCESPERWSVREGKVRGDQSLHAATKEHFTRDLPSVTSLHEKHSKSGHAEDCLEGKMDNNCESPERMSDREGKVRGDQALLGAIRKRVTKESLPSASSLREKLSKSDIMKVFLSGKIDNSYVLPERLSDREGKVQGDQTLHGATKGHDHREGLPSVSNLHQKHSKSGHAKECLCGQPDRNEREEKVDGAQALRGAISKVVTKEVFPSVSSLHEKFSKSDKVKEYTWGHVDESCDAPDHASEREGNVRGDQALHGAIRKRVTKEGLPSAASLHETPLEPGNKTSYLPDTPQLLDMINKAQIQYCECSKHHPGVTVSGDSQEVMITLQRDPPDVSSKILTVLCLLVCLAVLLFIRFQFLLCPYLDPD
ncbi:uncharacterized protein LOC134948181 isoform X1 [Pseudophryne corroboree]|uniref:uncharacterized protein LOC134948181 isoform X1 n=1 Tax=Pseudophryne corroboree TaxID=495146 RepID=UPI0030813658